MTVTTNKIHKHKISVSVGLCYKITSLYDVWTISQNNPAKPNKVEEDNMVH